MIQQTYVMVKPGFANNKNVIAEIKNRLKKVGLKIIEESYIKYDGKRAKMHYYEHIGKSFYPELEEYITSDKAYGMKVEGENAIILARSLAGSTKNPAIGTIRYDIPAMLGIETRITENVVHTSDSEQSAQRELKIFEDILRTNEINDCSL